MRVVLAAVLVLAAAPVSARVSFAQYSGPDSVVTGNGGTKINKDGVDFWTNGEPYGRYQVLGILSDERMDKLLSGHAIGSSGIAKKVHELGGDAVVVLGQDSQFRGTNAYLSNNYGYGSFGTARAVHKISTQMLVVKYLPAQ